MTPACAALRQHCSRLCDWNQNCILNVMKIWGNRIQYMRTGNVHLGCKCIIIAVWTRAVYCRHYGKFLNSYQLCSMHNPLQLLAILLANEGFLQTITVMKKQYISIKPATLGAGGSRWENGWMNSSSLTTLHWQTTNSKTLLNTIRISNGIITNHLPSHHSTR